MTPLDYCHTRGREIFFVFSCSSCFLLCPYCLRYTCTSCFLYTMRARPNIITNARRSTGPVSMMCSVIKSLYLRVFNGAVVDDCRVVFFNVRKIIIKTRVPNIKIMTEYEYYYYNKRLKKKK